MSGSNGNYTVVRYDQTADGQVVVKFLLQQPDEPGLLLRALVAGNADEPTIRSAIDAAIAEARQPGRLPAMTVLDQMIAAGPVPL